MNSCVKIAYIKHLATAGLRRGVLSGSGGEGSMAHNEAIRPSKGVLERIKEEEG
jgi:hypothetical protein